MAARPNVLVSRESDREVRYRLDDGFADDERRELPARPQDLDKATRQRLEEFGHL